MSDSLAASLLRVWDEAAEAVVALDADWRYRYLNRAAQAMLGLTEEAVGQDYRVVHPDVPGSEIATVHERVMRTRVAETMETYYAPIDTYVRVRVLPWPGSGIVLSIRDVTQERRPEVRLRRNLDLYTQVLEHMTQAVTLRDPDGRFLLANRAAAARLGRPPEEIVGRTSDDLFSPEIAEQVRAVDARVLATGQPQDSPAVHQLHPDRQVLSRVFPICDAEGEIVGIVTTVMDVTELAMAQAELSASQLRFRRVFASTSLGVLVLREDGAIVEANTAFCRLAGCARTALVGRSGAHLLRGRVSGWGAQDGEEGFEVEDELVRSDGRVVPVLLTINTFDGTDGQGRMISCVVRDLTVVRQLQAQLVSAERMEALAWLAASMAHDANNILAAVSGYAELLRDQVRTLPTAQRYLDGIDRSLSRAEERVAALSAFAGGAAGHPQVLDLQVVVHEMAELLRRVLPSGVQLSTELRPAVADVDPAQLRQLLLNLVLNAGQAGAGSVVLRTGPAGPGSVVVTVSDDGHGMSPEVAAASFEPFFTTSRSSGALGVGLSTASQIALQHGGTLQVRTAPGEGAVFTLTLPAAQAPVAAPVVPAPPGCVVVADDDPALRAWVVATLEGAGYAVVSAQNGREALALAEAARLVVSDVDMPLMDGLELAAALGSREPAVPVLLVSGAAHPEVGAEKPFLAKPFTGAQLLGAVEAVLVAAS